MAFMIGYDGLYLLFAGGEFLVGSQFCSLKHVVW